MKLALACPSHRRKFGGRARPGGSRERETWGIWEPKAHGSGGAVDGGCGVAGRRGREAPGRGSGGAPGASQTPTGRGDSGSRKQLGFFFFFSYNPLWPPDWLRPVTRPTGRTELEARRPLTLRRFHRPPPAGTSGSASLLDSAPRPFPGAAGRMGCRGPAGWASRTVTELSVQRSRGLGNPQAAPVQLGTGVPVQARPE